MKSNEDIIVEFYSKDTEDGRLRGFSLEKIRTQELISRFLPISPAKILDVGGAAGVYSFWLHDLGHEVHLVDIVPLHIEQALGISTKTKRILGSIAVGDARSLAFDANTVDVVLLLGPMYHLTEKEDRMKALSEAKRVLKPGGVMFAAGITQFASMLDGFYWDFVSDPAFVTMMNQDVETGQHRPTRPEFFTNTIFHHPDLLQSEVVKSGFQTVELFGIECFGRYIPGLDEKCEDEEYRKLLLSTIRKVEQEKTMIGFSSHILAVGTK